VTTGTRQTTLLSETPETVLTEGGWQHPSKEKVTGHHPRAALDPKQKYVLPGLYHISLMRAYRTSNFATHRPTDPADCD
jgi:hypothetical protein